MRTLLLFALTSLLAACPGPNRPLSDRQVAAEVAPRPDAAPAAVVAEPPPDAAVPEPPPPPPAAAPERPADWAVADADLAKAIKTLTAALKSAGSADPIASLILRGRLAGLEWRKSCTGAVQGLCIAKAKAPKKPLKRCGPPSVEQWVAKKRTGDQKKAIDDLTKTVALWHDGAILDDAGETSGDRATQVAMVVADADLALDDASLEAVFALPAPTDLDFKKDQKRAMKSFNDWFVALTKAGEDARTRYEHLAIDEKRIAALDPEGALAAVARIGQLYDQFAATLETMAIPGDVAADADAITAYCDTLGDKAEPLEEKAKQAWSLCAAKATELGVTGPWADLCAASAPPE